LATATSFAAAQHGAALPPGLGGATGTPHCHFRQLPLQEITTLCTTMSLAFPHPSQMQDALAKRSSPQLFFEIVIEAICNFCFYVWFAHFVCHKEFSNGTIIFSFFSTFETHY